MTDSAVYQHYLRLLARAPVPASRPLGPAPAPAQIAGANPRRDRGVTMSRYDDLRRIREAKFAAKAAEPVRRDVIPKLPDADSCCVRPTETSIAKSVRRSNGIQAPCADRPADESVSPQSGIRQSPVTKPVTKPPVTKPISVTKPAEPPLSRGQAPKKGGRPTIGDKPMTPAERMRRYRARRRAQKAST